MPRAATTSDAFNAVAEPRRREILDYLAARERPVGEIATELRMEQPSVSKHLRVLLETGLVQARRDGRRMLYRTEGAAIRPLYEWTNTFERLWRNQLTRIKERAENPQPKGEQKMTPTLSPVTDLTLTIKEEIFVRASLEATFAALLDELGPYGQRPDGSPMNMKLEAWPGGRWFRDLGDNNGHFWGHVQAIKRPTLLEMTGPLFMSYPVASNLQYRLEPAEGGTLIRFHHLAFGLIDDEHRKNVSHGWAHIHERVKQRAQGESKK